MRFLTYCDYNYWSAAEALVKYWELRQEFFGERAFLPLTQTGNGALDGEDVITLHTGKFALLRPTPRGQPVMFVDRNRVLPTSTTESKLRSVFYMFQQMTIAPSAQTMGCHLLVLLVTPRNSPVDMSFVRGAVNAIRTFPAKIYIHFLLCLPKYGMTPLIQKMIVPAISYAISNEHGLKLHTKSVGEPILKDLEKELGLTPDCFPASIGGTWKYQNHTFWCRGKVREEFIEENNSPRKRASSATTNKRKRTKDLNVIHSRLKRERRKTEELELRARHSCLLAENRNLKHTNVLLEKLVRDAQGIIHSVGSSQLPNQIPHTSYATTRGGGVYLPGVMPVNARLHLNASQISTARYARPMVEGTLDEATAVASDVDYGLGNSDTKQAAASIPGQITQLGTVTSQAPTLSSSIDAIMNQSPEVQRLVLAALNTEGSTQPTRARPEATSFQMASNSASAAAVRYSNNPQTQLPPQQTPNNQFDLLSFLFGSGQTS